MLGALFSILSITLFHSTIAVWFAKMLRPVPPANSCACPSQLIFSLLHTSGRHLLWQHHFDIIHDASIKLPSIFLHNPSCLTWLVSFNAALFHIDLQRMLCAQTTSDRFIRTSFPAASLSKEIYLLWACVVFSREKKWGLFTLWTHIRLTREHGHEHIVLIVIPGFSGKNVRKHSSPLLIPLLANHQIHRLHQTIRLTKKWWYLQFSCAMNTGPKIVHLN